MPEFVTCLNCMDGRVQKAMIDWLTKEFDAEHVDMITEAGMDGFIVRHDDLPESLLHKIDISVEKHGSNDIFIVGHYDCGGHPGEREMHHEDVKLSIEKIKKLYPDCSVSGVWIPETWKPEKID